MVFGTCALGNVRRVITEQAKLAVCGEWFQRVAPPVFIDTSSQFGAGMALEAIGQALDRLEIPPDEVIISDRLPWTDGRICYAGIRESWEDDCRLLGGRHPPQIVSLLDPDKYLAVADACARARRFQEVLDAYRELSELKAAGKVAGVGVTATDWRVAQEIGEAVELDWIMLIGCFTVMHHPSELCEFMGRLAKQQIAIIISAVFHGGFLVGGSEFDGHQVHADDPVNRSLFVWRKSFAALCHGHGITPAHACIQFALSAPGVVAVAVDTSRIDRIAENVESAITKVPAAFWASMKDERLLADDYPFLG